jgi:hypothetical protein
MYKNRNCRLSAKKIPAQVCIPPDFRVSEDSRKILELREGERGRGRGERERDVCVCGRERQVQKWWVSSSSKSSDG